jgi:hypothetical protein
MHTNILDQPHFLPHNLHPLYPPRYTVLQSPRRSLPIRHGCRLLHVPDHVCRGDGTG